MTRPVRDLLGLLDEIEPPELWDSIVAARTRDSAGERSDFGHPPGPAQVVAEIASDRPRLGRRGALALAAVAATVGVVVVLLLANIGSDSQSVEVTPADGSSEIAAPTTTPDREAASVPASEVDAAVAAVIPVPSPWVPTVGDDSVWVASVQLDEVRQIDLATNEVVATVAVGDAPVGIGIGPDDVWVANSGDGTVSRIDPATSTVVATIDVGGSPFWVDGGSESIWVTNRDRIDRIDPETNTFVEIPLPGETTVVVEEAGAAWFPSGEAVYRIDLATNEIDTTIPLDAGLLVSISVGADSVWTAGASGDSVFRIDAVTNDVAAEIPLGEPRLGLWFGPGGLWVETQSCRPECQGSLVRIDPTTNAVADRLELPPGRVGAAISAGRDSLWVNDTAADEVVRIDVTATD